MEQAERIRSGSGSWLDRSRGRWRGSGSWRTCGSKELQKARPIAREMRYLLQLRLRVPSRIGVEPVGVRKAIRLRGDGVAALERAALRGLRLGDGLQRVRMRVVGGSQMVVRVLVQGVLTGPQTLHLANAQPVQRVLVIKTIGLGQAEADVRGIHFVGLLPGGVNAIHPAHGTGYAAAGGIPRHRGAGGVRVGATAGLVAGLAHVLLAQIGQLGGTLVADVLAEEQLLRFADLLGGATFGDGMSEIQLFPRLSPRSWALALLLG